ANSASLKYRSLIEIDRELLVVAISDRTLAVGEGRVNDRAASLQLARVLNRDSFGDAVINRDRGVRADGDEQPTRLDELLQIGHPHHASPPAHISPTLQP